MQLSRNNVWRVQLSEYINPENAHAMVVLYHCCAANVISVMRKQASHKEAYTKSSSYVACDVEFMELVDEFVSNVNVSTMADLHATYLNVYKSDGFHTDAIQVRSRKEVNQFLIEEIAQIVFTSARQRNSYERISIAPTRDADLWRLEEDSDEYKLHIISIAATVIRKMCHSCNKWSIKEYLNYEDSQLPENLAVFLRWCIGGRIKVEDKHLRISKINERANEVVPGIVREHFQESYSLHFY